MINVVYFDFVFTLLRFVIRFTIKVSINTKKMKEEEKNQECCPSFEPTPWDGVILEWNQKRFIKDRVCSIFYMPLNFGKVITRMNKLVEKSGANMPDWLCLSYHPSKWRMDLYLAVDKEVEGIENLSLSGRFYSKVFEGSFSETGKWAKIFEAEAKSKGFVIKKLYMWYTTCPKCAKKYGKNYIVFIGHIE